VRGVRLNGNVTYRDVENFFAPGEETIEINDDTYLLTRPVNGDDGSILSAGIRLQQNLRRLSRHLGDFALSLSWTHNRSSTDFRDPVSGERLPMPNTAENVARADLAYGREQFGARLRYRWRGKSLKSSFSDSGLSVWNRPAGSLDLNMGWQLNSNVQFGINGRNLLNEEQVQTTDYSGQLLRYRERFRQVSLTFRAKW
jgi:outer membrane receptor protein involved in Fe transport